MTKGLEAVLDECLNRIASGEHQAADACIAEYPALAAELGPLLHLAAELEVLREDVPPPPTGLSIGRQKLLQEAARLNELERDQAWARRLRLIPFGLQSVLRRSAAVVTLAAILVLSALGGGTIAASANSLPGDSLYSVKRMAEEVQLALTLDRQAKAELVQKLDERRREEAKAIATSHRVAETSFRGRVERMGDTSWTVSGVVVSISAETVLQGEITADTLVLAQVRSTSDGVLWAVRISAEPTKATPPPTLVPTPRPTETAAPTPIPPTPIPPTAIATRIESEPTAVPAEVRPSLTPLRVATQTPTRTPTASPVPPTPAPPREIKVRFKGKIDAMSAQSWTVDGQRVRINAGTRIDESQRRAEVGAVATVLALRQEDEGLLALEIQIEQPPTAPAQPFEFQGLIESWGATQWVVGGHILIVNLDTVIQGSPQKGLLAEVKSLRQSDGSLLAKSIVIRLPTEEVQFEGLIQEIHVGQWVVEGITVLIDAQTRIEGVPTVGATVEILGLLMPDGAVIGRRIAIKPLPAAPTEMPTVEATPTG